MKILTELTNLLIHGDAVVCTMLHVYWSVNHLKIPLSVFKVEALKRLK